MNIQIEKILSQPESSVLDFKKDIYDQYSDDKNSKILKDIISFSNTVRTETARIIFGVEEIDTGQFQINGISKSMDDANIQNLAADKLYPQPKFHYYEIVHKEKKIGIMEFPVTKYICPITCCIDYKGILKDKVYYRMGSRNTEADTPMTIKINDWLRTIPSDDEQIDFLSQALSIVINHETKLSKVISELLPKSIQFGYSNITELLRANLSQIPKDKFQDHTYRYQEIYIALADLRFEYGYGVNDQMFKNELENTQNVIKHRVPFHHSIFELEKVKDDFEKRKTLYACLDMPGKAYFQNINHTVKLFLFKDNLDNIFSNIRQRLIDEIINTR